MEQIVRRDGEIAPGFEQEEGQVLGGTPASGENFLEQAAFFHQLKNDTSELEQEVKDLAGIGVLALGMFEVELAVLLDIETFVLDLPAQASTLIGQQVDVVGGQGEIGDPFVMQGSDLALGIRLFF